MGRLQTTVIVARFGEEGGQEEAKEKEVADASGGGDGPGESGKRASVGCPYSMLARQSDEDLGAFSVDLRMFDHFQGQVSAAAIIVTTPIALPLVPLYGGWLYCGGGGKLLRWSNGCRCMHSPTDGGKLVSFVLTKLPLYG